MRCHFGDLQKRHKIAQLLGRSARREFREPANLLAYRIALSGHDDNSCVRSPTLHVLGMKTAEITDVEGIKHAPFFGRKIELRLVRLSHHLRVERGEDIEPTSAKPLKQSPRHRIFVDIPANGTQALRLSWRYWCSRCWASACSAARDASISS